MISFGLIHIDTIYEFDMIFGKYLEMFAACRMEYSFAICEGYHSPEDYNWILWSLCKMFMLWSLIYNFLKKNLEKKVPTMSDLMMKIYEIR